MAGIPILHLFEWNLMVLFVVGLIWALGWILMVRRDELIADTISGELKAIETEPSRPGVVLLRPPFLAFQAFR